MPSERRLLSLGRRHDPRDHGRLRAYDLQVTVNPEHTIDERSFSNNSVRYSVQMPAFGDPLRACEPESLLTTAEECGWNRASTPTASCTPGSTVRLGCPDCFGSPELRICEGRDACTALQEVRYTYPSVMGIRASAKPGRTSSSCARPRVSIRCSRGAAIIRKLRAESRLSHTHAN